MVELEEEAEIACLPPEEDVCRLCFAASSNISIDQKFPNQVDPDTGLIRLEELTWQDFKTRGFSVQVLRLYSAAMGIAEAKRRLEAKREKGVERYELAGALIARVEKIQQIKDPGGSSVFCVLDTRSAEHPAHAELRIRSGFQKKDLLKYREALQAVLGKIRPVSDLDRETA